MIVALFACTRNELRIGIIDKWYHDKDQHEFNKLISVFYASVLLLIMNFVITLSK